MDEARDAASLFVQLVRTNAGNRVGLVSFSTAASSPVAVPIGDFSDAPQQTITGPAPYTSGALGGLAAGGATTLGGGLIAAAAQIPLPGANPRTILLLTDGLQNTPPDVNDALGMLGGITVNAIGYGQPANLDGALLRNLASTHGGQYATGDTSLKLEKFFAQAFGNIFESGLLLDPEFDLAADQRAAPPLSFDVCEEERISAVLGWDDPDSALLMTVRTPGGVAIDASTPGIQAQSGRTWTFMRIPLPRGVERDGTWTIEVFRPGGVGEFPPPAPALRYFVNVVASGGALMRRALDLRRYYTGDTYNPVVQLQFSDGTEPPNVSVEITMTRPDASLGTLLSNSGLGGPADINGDVVPARQATLAQLEASAGKRLIGTVASSHTGDDASENNGGRFESAGAFGQVLTDALVIEGEYVFRARATYGDTCTATRELSWGLHVEIGIDPGRSEVTVVGEGPGPGGSRQGTIHAVPKDKYGNNLGPGQADGFTVSPASGTSLTSSVTDNGDGFYDIPVCWPPGASPGVIVGQPGRPPVSITPAPGPKPPRKKQSWWLWTLLALLGGYVLGRLDEGRK